MQSAKQKIRYRICNADRSAYVTISEEPSFEAILKKAKMINPAGTRLFLQDENSMIGDDESLKFCTNLMILSNHETWTPGHHDSPNSQASSSTSHADNHDQIQNPEQKTVEGPYVVLIDNSITQNDNDDYKMVNPTDTIEVEASAAVGTKAAFKDFVLPWDKLPTAIIKMLHDRKYLEKNNMLVVANLFVAELKAVNAEFPKEVIIKVGREASEKFPHSFLEMNGPVFLTQEPFTFIQKMVGIYNSRRRKPHAITHTIQEHKVSLAESRKRKLIADTVADYQPNIVDIEPELLIKKQWLLDMYDSAVETENLDTVKAYMRDTYGLQRKDINARPVYSTLIAEWPYLVRPEYFNTHFELLTGKNLDNFSTNFNSHREIIIDMTSSKNSKAVKQLLPLIRHETDELKCLKLIAAYFNENVNLIVQEFELGTTMSMVESAMKKETVAVTPMIAIVATPQRKVYYIFIDKVLQDEQSTLTLACRKLFGYYFIFNICYPEKLTTTMEFLQRLMLSILPEEVRGKKAKAGVMNNVNKLILSVVLEKRDRERM